MYLRFVEGTDSQAWRSSTGIIIMSRILKDENRLEPYQVDVVEATFAWFNEHVPVPPFTSKLKSGSWSDDAVAWFLSEAIEPIQRMWDLVAILKDHGVPVRVLRTASPGMIVYRDEFQVVAETKRG